MLENINRSLLNATFHHVDKAFLTEVIRLMDSFYKGSSSKRSVRIKEYFEIDHSDSDDYQMNIGVPESWLNRNSVDLGETVLLRNDEPSPVIF